MARNNPNGANQYKPDPRQILFLSQFLDPKSTNFSNVYRSGVAAGFSEEYSRNLMNQMPTWLSTKLDELGMMDKVNRNLHEFLDHEDDRLKFDASKFVAETVGKAVYSKRTELTGAGGEKLIDPDTKEQVNKALDEYFKKNIG